MPVLRLTLPAILVCCLPCPCLQVAKAKQSDKEKRESLSTLVAYLSIAYELDGKCHALSSDQRLGLILEANDLLRELKIRKDLEHFASHPIQGFGCDHPFTKLLLERVGSFAQKYMDKRYPPKPVGQLTADQPSDPQASQPVEIQGTQTLKIQQCGDSTQSGLWVHVEIPSELKALHRPFGSLVVRGSDILSIWEDNDIGPVAQYWPADTPRLSAPVQIDSGLGKDLRMTRAGLAYRILEAGGVRIQYDAVPAESAKVFDGIIDSACLVTNLDEVQRRHELDRMVSSAREGQNLILTHPLNDWADALYPGKARNKESSDKLNERQRHILADKLQERADSLKETLLVLNPWLSKVFGPQMDGFTVHMNLSTLNNGPIAGTRKGADGFVIDINTVVLRGLFLASRSGSREAGFFQLRDMIRGLDPNDPDIVPSYGASFGRINQSNVIPQTLRAFDIMDVRFTDALDFVLLHEFGHIVLGHDLSLSPGDCDRRMPIEAEADEFAASILTVRDPYRLRIRRPGIDYDKDPGQSTYRDFFAWAYSLSGIGNVSRSTCGYMPVDLRRQSTESVARKVLGLVY